MTLPEPASGHQDVVAFGVAGISTRHDRTSEVDAAYERKTPHDLSGSRRGERILVVHTRVAHPGHDLARPELVELH